MPGQKSKNIKFCAYLRLQDLHPVEVIKESRGKAEFVYDISEREWTIHQLNFNSSKYPDYANNLDAIKDMAY